MNRRDFLLRSSTAAAMGAASGCLAKPAHRSGPPPRAPHAEPGKARNVIFMVSDGMSTGTLTLADLMRRQRDGRPSNWVSLWNKPGVRRATMSTYSADAWVTDSAAAGSAWGCGHHVNNGVINITNEGRQVMPLLVQAQQQGYATGLITTTRVTHATPASFIANVPKRDMSGPIAQQILERHPHIVLGGGAKHFPEPLLAKYPERHVVRTRKDLLALERVALQGIGGKGNFPLLGLFARDHIPMVLERTPETPSLTEMVRVAFPRMFGGFGVVLQVEGGRVDHAAHNNDAASLIAEQLDFDDAIGEVMHIAENQQTLVIITTDHANANPGLTLYGKPGKDAFQRLTKVTHSFDWIWEEVEKRPAELKGAAAAELVEAATGIGLDETQRAMLAAAIHKKRVAPFATANTWTSVLGAMLADDLGVAFTGPNHTSDMVEVTAFGPGAENLPPFIDNVDLHALVVNALGLEPAKQLPGTDALIEPAHGVNDD